MCFPTKKEHHPKDKKHKKKISHQGEEESPKPGGHGAPGGAAGGGDSSTELEVDLTVAEAPDQMPECNLEPFSWRRQQFTAEQLL